MNKKKYKEYTTDLELAGQPPEKMEEDHLSGSFFPGSEKNHSGKGCIGPWRP